MNARAATAMERGRLIDPSFSWVREDWLDFVLAKVSPMLTIKRVMAQVFQVEKIEDGMIKLMLKPNKKFNGFKAGQFVVLRVQINGVFQQRCYSIVSYKGEQLVLGIKQQGLVSNHIANQLKSGDVIEISQAQGEFGLDDSTKPCLFIASGSGITPIIPMLKQALQRAQSPVTLLYYSRDHAFVETIRLLEANYSYFKAILVDTTIAHEHFSKQHLLDYCADYQDREVFACGATGLIRTVRDEWKKAKLSDRLHLETFVSDIEPSAEAQAMPVTFTRSDKMLEVKGSLLLGAEAGGLKPAYGCRMGVCNTCVCTKTSGTVRNQLTGELDHQPNTQIRLCISEAVSPVTLDV